MENLTENRKIICIEEFDGFYESPLDAMMDNAIESIFTDHATGCNSRVPDEVWMCSFKTAWPKIAKEYAENFNHRIQEWGDSRHDLKLEYESLDSPKYYNYSTDRLFCLVPESSVLFMFEKSKAENHETLSKVITERFTSRDGFISSYPATLDEWPATPSEWDHNQLGALLTAFIEIENMGDSLNTWDLMESSSSDGFFDTIVFDCLTPELVAYVNFSDEEQRENGKTLDEIPEFSEWVKTYTPEKGVTP